MPSDLNLSVHRSLSANYYLLITIHTSVTYNIVTIDRVKFSDVSALCVFREWMVMVPR